MDLKLIENWKSVLAGAWSVRLMAICGILGALNEVAVYLPQLGVSVPSWVFAGLSLASLISRVLYQAGVSK